MGPALVPAASRSGVVTPTPICVSQLSTSLQRVFSGVMHLFETPFSRLFLVLDATVVKHSTTEAMQLKDIDDREIVCPQPKAPRHLGFQARSSFILVSCFVLFTHRCSYLFYLFPNAHR